MENQHLESHSRAYSEVKIRGNSLTVVAKKCSMCGDAALWESAFAHGSSKNGFSHDWIGHDEYFAVGDSP